MDAAALEQLGFSDFVHIRISMRDGKRRMIWSRFIGHGQHISFVLVYSNNKWMVEKISTKGKIAEQAVQKYIPNKTISEMVDFISNVFMKSKKLE